MIGARLGQDEFAVERWNPIPDGIEILVVGEHTEYFG